MKAGTTEHIKFKRLKRILGVPLFHAVGILESLWQCTSQCADDGAIGRYTNQEIADYLEWEGDADALIDALVQSRWLDVDDVNRLTVHDWEDHAPNFVKDRARKRAGKSRNKQEQNGKSPDVPEKSEAFAINQAQPNQVSPSCADRNAPETEGGGEREREWEEFQSLLHGRGVSTAPSLVRRCQTELGLTARQSGLIAGWYVRNHPDSKAGLLNTFFSKELTPNYAKKLLAELERPP